MGSLFSAWRDWRDRHEVLRDARRQQADKREELRFKVTDDLTYALSALERGDHAYATAIWTNLVKSHLEAARISPLALKVLIGLKRFDEAEALMQANYRKYPGEASFAKGLAEIAHEKRDVDTAIERWAILRKKFPGVVEGYSRGADAFLEKGQLQQATDLALEAIKRFPENIGGPLAYARVAVREKKWDDALRRWQPLRDKFNFIAGYTGGAEALCHLGRWGEAEDLLNAGRLRFSNEVNLHCELGRIAERKGDIPEAVKRWKDTLYRFPLDMNVHFVASGAFERLDEPAEAEATLHAAIDRFPAELRPRLELAKLLHYKHQNFIAAAEAWADIRRVAPDYEEAYIVGADALRRARRSEDADALCDEHRLRFKLG